MKRSLGSTVLPVAAPAWLIGTYDASGRPNAATAAWAGICCSKPPCLNFSLRRATHTYAAVLERRCFTVSVPSERHVVQTDFFGIYSGRDRDKFAAAGLTPERAGTVDAPFPAEFPLVFECRLLHHHELGLHTLFVGEVLDARCDEELLGPDGKPDVARLQPFVYGSGGYFRVGERLADGHSVGKRLAT
jgi:flavin reductase (DIM6/NTAB) family NADH-FMN oxidoreductase RutF